MKYWKILNDKTAAKVWNSHLKQLQDYTYFQLYEWGEHRRSYGWTPLRCIAYNDDKEILGMVQVLYRRYKFGVGTMWISGGPVGDISSWNQDLRALLLETTKSKLLYIRFFSNRKITKKDKDFIISKGWKPCRHKLRSGLSMKLDLDKNLEEIQKDMSRNWRRNLKRSTKSKLPISQWVNPDFDEIRAVYQSMESYKGLQVQFSKEELQCMFQKFGEKIVLYKCLDKEGQVVALRGCVILHHFGWDLFAATSSSGRKLYASYALFWELLKHCVNSGVKEYDLMGIDPINNSGVYNFKKGTGAEYIKYLGEWDWATNPILRWAANIKVYLLRRNGRVEPGL